jgi:eukaryotic-like serine/threonine-protein kinase
LQGDMKEMPAPISYLPGMQIDHYTIIRVLGQGVANHVYLGRDLTNQQQVVLKCPREDVIGGAGIFKAYRQEAKLGKLLDHPSLQCLLNQDERREREYLVFEYIPGRVLRKVLQEYPDSVMPEEKAVSILLPICSVLVYLHAQGVIHRDVKPENILLGDDGSVRLLDFGISLCQEKLPHTKPQDRHKRRRLRLPLANVVGTPAYMSPERLRGEEGDERSDIYAIGVVLYEMLCGHTLFEDADGFTITNRQIVYDPPDILQQNSTLSPALATVIMRAIRRNPEKRYASMQHLLDDLSNLDKVTPQDYIPDRPLFGGRYREVLQISFIIFLIIVAIIAFGFIVQFFHHAT